MKDGTIVELENVAPDPALGYEMKVDENVLQYVDDDLIEATWHTHPFSDPVLSDEDRVGFEAWPALEHIIIGRRDGATAIERYRIEDGMVMVCS